MAPSKVTKRDGASRRKAPAAVPKVKSQTIKKTPKITKTKVPVAALSTPMTPGWTSAHPDIFGLPESFSPKMPSPFSNRRMTRRSSIFVTKKMLASTMDNVLPMLEFKKPTIRSRRGSIMPSQPSPLSPIATRSRRRASVYISTSIQGFKTITEVTNTRKVSNTKISKNVPDKPIVPLKSPKQSRSRSPSPKKVTEKPKTKSASSKEVTSMTQLKSRSRSRSPKKSLQKKPSSAQRARASRGQTTPGSTKSTPKPPVSPKRLRQTPRVKVTRPTPVKTPSTKNKGSPKSLREVAKKGDGALATPINTPTVGQSKATVKNTPRPVAERQTKSLVKDSEKSASVTPVPAKVKATPVAAKIKATPVVVKIKATPVPAKIKATPVVVKGTPIIGTVTPVTIRITPVDGKSTSKLIKSTNASYRTPLVKKSSKSMKTKKVIMMSPKPDSPSLILSKSSAKPVVKTPFKAAKMLGKNESPTGNTPIKAARVLGKVISIPTPDSMKKTKRSRSQINVLLTSTPLKAKRKRPAEAPPPVSEIRLMTNVQQSSSQDESFLPSTVKSLKLARSLDAGQGDASFDVTVNGDHGNTTVEKPASTWGWMCQIL